MTKKQELKKLFEKMILSISNKIKLNAFIIFGSRARGNPLPHSDYDIVIIGDFEEEYLARTEWVIQTTPSVPVDVFCYTDEEFNEMFHQYNLTAIDAVDEGIFLIGDKFMTKYQNKLKFFKEKGLKKEDRILYHPSI